MDEHEGIRYLYFDALYAIKVQNWVIEKSGGLSGVKNINPLESALGHIKNDFYYPEITDKLCHLVFSIVKNHPFNDGNKRSSIALGAYFLELNGYDYVIRNFVFEMENIVVYVADSIINKDLLRAIITSILYEEEHSEDLKIKIIEAITTAQNKNN